MDCEKFEAAILDELYGELDELTSASAKRHVAGCARCSARLGGLRATRRIAVIPQLEPSDDLEDRIFRAIERAHAQPAPRRLAEVVSLAGAWAMRPQTAMAAVFLVMIGTSVLLLRGTSARAPASSEVTVTERGTPAPAACAVPLPPGEAPAELEHQKTTAVASAGADKQPGWASAPPPPSPPSQAQSPAGGGAALATQPAARAAPDLVFAQPPPVLGNSGSDDLFDAALRSYRAGRFDEAAREFDAIGPSDPNAPDLWAARSVRDGKGCRAAVGRFDKTAQRYRQASPGWDALLEGALCYRALGDLATARARLNALLGVDSHKDRARAELDRIDELQQAQANRDTPAPAPAKPAAKARPPSAAAAPAIPASPAAPPQSAGEATDPLR